MELNVLAGNVESKHATPTAEQETVMAAPRWGGAGKLSVALFVVLFIAAPFLTPNFAMGSMPVKRTLTGCVVGADSSVSRSINEPTSLLKHTRYDSNKALIWLLTKARNSL